MITCVIFNGEYFVERGVCTVLFARIFSNFNLLLSHHYTGVLSTLQSLLLHRATAHSISGT